jgi:glycosyltransferase involved in cell wall biosynthesis
VLKKALNGYKVPVKSVVELANAMEKLINSPSDRKRMGAHSRKKLKRI